MRSHSLEAVDARHHDVEDHQRRLLVLHDLDGRLAIAGGDDLVAFELKIQGDQLEDTGIVIHDQNQRLSLRHCLPPYFVLCLPSYFPPAATVGE